MVVYRAKRAKSGKMMYFKDGKITSKAKYQARPKNNKSRSRTKSKGSNTNRNGVKNMKRIPHPSVTGMASGLAIAAYLNSGTPSVSARGRVVREGVDNVVKDVTDGELGKAFNTLSNNAINMVASDDGRKTLITAGAVAVLGALVRSRLPQLKLGGSKLYFRV